MRVDVSFMGINARFIVCVGLGAAVGLLVGGLFSWSGMLVGLVLGVFVGLAFSN